MIFFSSPNLRKIYIFLEITLLVYSLIQTYLNVEKLKELAGKTMESLIVEESMGENTVVMYSKGYYAILDTGEALYHVAELEGKPRERFRKWIRQLISKKHRIPDDP